MVKKLDANYTYEEIATELGITMKRAHYECALALGKLVYGLKKNLQSAGVRRVQD